MCGGLGDAPPRPGGDCRVPGPPPPGRAAAGGGPGVSARGLRRRPRELRARPCSRLVQRAGDVPTRDPRQLGRQAGPLAGALRQAAPHRSARSRHHGNTGAGARLGRQERAVRAALRPEIATKVDGASDSDNNDFVAQEATVTASLGSDLRGTLHAGWRHATLADAAGNVITSGTSYGAGGYGIAALGKGAVLRAGLGARRVEPDGGPPRTPLTAQIGLGLRPGRYTAVGLGCSRPPSDQPAGLMHQDLTIEP